MQNALDSKADASNIPTKTSDLTNDSGFITSSSLPTKVSDLTNDSGFITNTVNNLTNYYTKTNTYTKSEVDSLISSVSSLDIEVVQTLPTQDISTSTIYLVPKTSSTNDNYDEYIYVNNSWEHIGSTEVDLSNYYTKTQTDNLLDDKADVSSLSTVATTGSYNDLSNKPTIPTKTSDLTNDSGFIDGLVILSYGNSTWNDFIAAYQKNKVVYCRASSNSNPASGSQTRLAFMAYVNNASSPTEVEFQYYRSVSSHTNSQQGDQVYVYKLTSAGSWTVITRNTFSKVVAGTGLSSSYSNGAITLSANSQNETDPVFSASAASGITSSDITSWNNKSDFSGSYNDLTDLPVQTDIRINNSSIISGGVANLGVNPDYNSSTNPLATMKTVSQGMNAVMGVINRKQDTLVSGTNIKTINNESLLGSGNISISGGVTSYNDLTDKPIYDASYVELATGSTITNEQYQELKDAITNLNILNLNGKAAKGFYTSGNIIIIVGTLGNQTARYTVSKTDNNHTVSLTKSFLGYDSDVQDLYETKQNILVSGANIKTINGSSILGSGDISVGGEKVPIGTIFEFPTDDATKLPTGYLFCDGSAVSRTQYADLFGVIGTTWGSGDGSTTFNLPSKAGLVTVGVSTDDEEFNTIGDTFGEKEHRLTINEMPSHNHSTVYMCSFPGGVANTRTGYGYNEVELNKSSYGNSVSNTGGGYAHNNIQPSVVSNYIIKASNVSQLPDEAEVVDGYSTSTTDAYSANYINNMILNAVYPVGSIYMSINSTSPATLFGGRWEAISQGRTLVGVGTGTDINGDSMTWAAEAEGGEYLHTLTIDEMPSHNHSVNTIFPFTIGSNRTAVANSTSNNVTGTAGDVVLNTGGGQAHNNIQPFFAVYMWKRTA